jgi:hypothetical protein
MTASTKGAIAHTPRRRIGGRLAPVTATLAGALLTTVQFATPALANPARDAIEGYFAWMKANGATQAEYSEIVETAPSDATVRDIKFGWDLAFNIAGKDIDIDIRFSLPEARLQGVETRKNGVFVNRLEQPGEMTFELSGGVTDDGAREAFKFSGSQFDAVTTGYFQPYVTIAPDDAHPVSRFFPAVRTMLGAVVKSSSARLVEMKSELPNGAFSSERYEQVSLKDMLDGRIGEQRIERTLSESRHVSPAGSGDDTEFKLTQETGSYVITGSDIRPILRAFAVLPADEKVGETIIEAISIDGMKIDAPFAKISVDAVTVDDTRLPSDVTPFDLGTFLDQAALGTLPQDEAGVMPLVEGALGVLQEFSVAGSEVSSLKVTSDEVNGTVEKMSLKEASYRGVGAFGIEGVAVTSKQHNGKFDLDSFHMTDLRLAPLVSYLRFAIATKMSKPSITEILSVMPMLGGIDMKGLAISSDEMPGPVRLDSYTLAMSDFIDPIPTSIEIKTEGASLPLELLDDETAEKLFTKLGIKQINYDDHIRLHWDEDSKDLMLEPLKMSVEGGGEVELTAAFGGIPRIVFENPEQAQAAVATATLKQARLSIRDAKLIAAYLELQSDDVGVPAEALAGALADQATASLGPIQGSPFAKSLDGALRSFLVSPDELVIEMTPKSPVPAAMILGLAATTPASLPEVLGLSAKANGN